MTLDAAIGPASTRLVGRHSLLLLRAQLVGNEKALAALREVTRSHYVDPAEAAKRLEAHGATGAAALLKEALPSTKTARSGDLGEILATEIAERDLGYVVPIRRLRWKDGRDLALRGDDITGTKHSERGTLQILKGEAKSRASLASRVLDEAAAALDGHRGRPSRHSVLFVANRLRELGDDDAASELEEATLNSFRGLTVEHLVATVSGNDAETLLEAFLVARRGHRRRLHAAGVHLEDHGDAIASLFDGM